jgi:UDP-glucose 4-epimerase
MPETIPLFPRGRGHHLITGGAGFIGSHLAERLLAAGHAVTVLDNLSTGRFANLAGLAAHPDFTFVQGDVSDEALLDELGRGASAVYHLAAVVGVRLVLEDPLRVIEENIFGTRTVLEAARRHRLPTFIASTSEIYGKNPAVPFHEESDRVLGSPTCARWSYSTSKAVDEIMALGYHRRYGLPVVVGRFFNTVGPRQAGEYGMVLPRFVEQVRTGQPITVFGDGEQRRCFCDVRDVTRAVLWLMETPAAVGQVFNIGGSHEMSIIELARTVIAARPAGAAPLADPPVRFVDYESAYGPGYEEFPRRIPDTTRLRDLTGWEPEIPFADTLASLFAEPRRRAAPRTPPLARPEPRLTAVAGTD